MSILRWYRRRGELGIWHRLTDPTGRQMYSAVGWFFGRQFVLEAGWFSPWFSVSWV